MLSVRAVSNSTFNLKYSENLLVLFGPVCGKMKVESLEQGKALGGYV